MKTLLLTPWNEPHAILSWRDAVTMKYEETADVVSEYERIVCSPSTTWKVPAVMRLKKLPPVGKRGIKFSRQNVYLRDRYRCQYCGSREVPVKDLTYDHVLPRSKGGKTDWNNIVTCCKTCNSLKGDKTCAQAKMFPRKAPVKPKSLPLQPSIIDIERAPPEWLDYLSN